MSLDWTDVLHRLQCYRTGLHHIRPPCPAESIDYTQRLLGSMPETLVKMLRTFNGAKLFNLEGPVYSIFGVSTIPRLPELDWAPDWYIDKFTPLWRRSSGRVRDWAIAMTNYGGLVLMDEYGLVSEWDTSQRNWSQRNTQIETWIGTVFYEGDICLHELGKPG
jgi:hypothetical protein